MFCAISGEAPQEPVVSKLTGTLYEKRLIEAHIARHGTDPLTHEPLTLDDLVPLGGSSKATVVRPPRPPQLTSIPSLLAAFQNEWDALALETFGLREELARAREELSTALYQQDAAIRVITRLTKERDEARAALAALRAVGGGAAAAAAGNGADAGGDEMVLDDVALSEELAAEVDGLQAQLSKGRKKRTTPPSWATAAQVSEFAVLASAEVPEIPKTPAAIAVQDSCVAVGLVSEGVYFYSLEDGALGVKQTVTVGEPVLSVVSLPDGLVVGTESGAVHVYTGTAQTGFKPVGHIAPRSGASGRVTSLAVHPGNRIVGAVRDKGWAFYDIQACKLVARVATSDHLTTCAFHPDGHLFACGTAKGSVKLFFTKSGEQVASFEAPEAASAGGSAVASLAFSENGFWFAATWTGSPSAVIFDLRKEGDAAVAKVLEVGDANGPTLAWDYSAQFLAAASGSSIVVLAYNKSAKSWSETLKTSVEDAISVRWGEDAKTLAVLEKSGRLSLLGVKE